MKIEAVITCVNYSDFLAHTLSENLQHLDNVVVVTDPEDKATEALCSKLSVQSIDTKVWYENGDPFNKARGINLGLSHLRHDGWLLHMDADVVLPHRFRSMAQKTKLHKDYIYGADRVNVTGHEKWERIYRTDFKQLKYHCIVEPHTDHEVGARLIHHDYGYVPIGYFQLWHSSQRRKYPVNSGSAEHSDVLFAVQWPREKRLLLPELWVYHLESEKSGFGLNWQGRKCKQFCKCHPHKPHYPKHPHQPCYCHPHHPHKGE